MTGSSDVVLCRFADRAEASSQAAHQIATALEVQLAKTGKASMLVSGGTSPAQCLAELSGKALPWSEISVSLTDERCVPATHEASNQRMLREYLMQGSAGTVNFVPLNEIGRAFTDSLAICLVGMGEDGHFASIFPDNPELQYLLDPNTEPEVSQVRTAASEHLRVTANLSLLMKASRILLLAFGETKLGLIQDPVGLPVAALLNQTLNQRRVPVQICWAP